MVKWGVVGFPLSSNTSKKFLCCSINCRYFSLYVLARSLSTSLRQFDAKGACASRPRYFHSCGGKFLQMVPPLPFPAVYFKGTVRLIRLGALYSTRIQSFLYQLQFLRRMGKRFASPATYLSELKSCCIFRSRNA